MPELAEVALFAKDLNTLAPKNRITEISFLNSTDGGKVVIPQQCRKLLKNLVGKKVSFTSSGKKIQLVVAKEIVCEIRLGMTGQFHLERLNNHWRRHYFLHFKLGNKSVYYADPRRFGRVVLPGDSKFSLGGYTANGRFVLNKNLVVPRGFLTTPRISWLLVTGSATGVGNYMANEALGRLHLSPYTPCKNSNEAKRILGMCQQIAKESFAKGGNSFGTKFFRIDGKEGKYFENCLFYQNKKISRKNYRGRPVFSLFKDEKKLTSS